MDTVVVTRLLVSKKEDEAVAAQRLLAEAAHASQAERDAAVAVLIEALKQDEKRVRRRNAVRVAAGLGFIGLIVGGIFFAFNWNGGRHVPVIFYFIWPRLILNRFRRTEARCSLLRRHVALALAHHDDVRALGPLIEAYAAAGDDSERHAVAGAITGLLPFVACGHESLLNDRQRAALNTTLDRWNPNKAGTTDEDIDGFVALVEVAARVGDKSAADALTALLAKGAKADDEWRLIRAAQAGLATLLNERLGVTPQVTVGAPRSRARP